ncbi:acetoin utilization protein AcuC [Tistlia consotensis]|uniref:Acetoin utilization protein AcuC n=1 Tax=Tistlia consotensis USBA 355 TaxID=560819 RepID=A0A1Y6CNZ0_9PROT|nr:acetoin utilization protein AcuC [Tistlia consotensis]SMF77779.1 acetoin utilization protein AcuC [Tistlia consotensis USBA 355]SNS20599.1 acetoin utilization protein AcuC [Tistlia consotensis]
MEGSQIPLPAPTPALDRPLLIGSEIYRRSTYGSRHPLAIPRVSTALDLCRALGWVAEGRYLDSPRATPAELARFHAPAYVAAVQAAEAGQAVSEEAKARFNIGVNGNPVFPEIFRRPATACGASIQAGRLLAALPPDHGPATIYSPAGGTHHGRPDRASGFCYFNDPVLAILALLDGGLERIFYLDLDAHHGDGVQDAFHDDPRVFTLSIHEAGRWPMKPREPGGPGGLADRAGGPEGGWAARNLPVPPGFNDSELAFLVEAAVLPLIEAFEPEALVVQCGADALEDDPLSRLSLSNLALWRAVATVLPTAPRRLVTGGGGYNPWSVGRAWAGVWATVNGFAIPERLPAEAEALLRALSWRHSRGRNPPERWFTTLADPPRPGAIRDEIRAMARAVLA